MGNQEESHNKLHYQAINYNEEEIVKLFPDSFFVIEFVSKLTSTNKSGVV